MTPNPQDSAVALEVERAIREALDAFPNGWECAFIKSIEKEWGGGVEIGHPWEDEGLAEVITVDTENYSDSPAAAKIAAHIMACNPEAMRTLLAEIDRLRASQSDGTSGGWISVDERLPADGESVVVLYWPYNNRSNHQCMTGAVFNAYSGLFLTDTDGDELHPPSHWMPAPPLPNQGENHVG